MRPRLPGASGVPAAVTTSKYTAAAVRGVSALSFHALVCPIPISVSPTHADFLPAEMACAIIPDTRSSFVVCTSSVALKPIWRCPPSSLANMRRNDCLKIDVANESVSTITPFVLFGSPFISSSPVWSRQPANRSTTCPLFDTRFDRAS
jgi:hypothetical protein